MNQNYSLENFIKAVVTTANKETEVKDLELRTAFEIFKSFKKNMVRKETMSFYNQHLNYIITDLEEIKIKRTSEISKNLLVNYQHRLLNKGNIKPITINKRITAFLTMLNDLNEYEYIQQPLIKNQITTDYTN